MKAKTQWQQGQTAASKAQIRQAKALFVRGCSSSMPKFGVFSACVLLSVVFNSAAHATSGVKLAADAKKQIGVTTSYDPSYRQMDFPRGDVPQASGVCTDVVVRAYRLQNIDLQQLLNADMKQNWSAYPKL